MKILAGRIILLANMTDDYCSGNIILVPKSINFCVQNLGYLSKENLRGKKGYGKHHASF